MTDFQNIYLKDVRFRKKGCLIRTFLGSCHRRIVTKLKKNKKTKKEKRERLFLENKQRKKTKTEKERFEEQKEKETLEKRSYSFG